MLAFAFAPAPRPPRPPAPGGAGGRRVVLVSAIAAALATTQPWIAVQFERLFGAHPGPPGWQSNAGFTCLCTCLLVAMLAVAETRAKSTQEATRPASAFLTALCAIALAVEWSAGPGQLRGVSATWTAAFWLAAVSVPALLVACLARCPRNPSHGAVEAT
jgi:phosphatidylserine synthase